VIATGQWRHENERAEKPQTIILRQRPSRVWGGGNPFPQGKKKRARESQASAALKGRGTIWGVKKLPLLYEPAQSDKRGQDRGSLKAPQSRGGGGEIEEKRRNNIGRKKKKEMSHQIKQNSKPTFQKIEGSSANTRAASKK